jgi:hypothetical protein
METFASEAAAHRAPLLRTSNSVDAVSLISLRVSVNRELCSGVCVCVCVCVYTLLVLVCVCVLVYTHTHTHTHTHTQGVSDLAGTWSWT